MDKAASELPQFYRASVDDLYALHVAEVRATNCVSALRATKNDRIAGEIAPLIEATKNLLARVDGMREVER